MAAAKTKKTKPAPRLHYNKTALLKDYEQTFNMMMKALAVIIGFALVYFLGMATFLGGFSHTPHKDFVEQFGGADGRIEIEYSGLKLPMNGGESIEELRAQHAEEHGEAAH